MSDEARRSIDRLDQRVAELQGSVARIGEQLDRIEVSLARMSAALEVRVEIDRQREGRLSELASSVVGLDKSPAGWALLVAIAGGGIGGISMCLPKRVANQLQAVDPQLKAIDPHQLVRDTGESP